MSFNINTIKNDITLYQGKMNRILETNQKGHNRSVAQTITADALNSTVTLKNAARSSINQIGIFYQSVLGAAKELTQILVQAQTSMTALSNSLNGEQAESSIIQSVESLVGKSGTLSERISHFSWMNATPLAGNNTISFSSTQPESTERYQTSEATFTQNTTEVTTGSLATVRFFGDAFKPSASFSNIKYAGTAASAGELTGKLSFDFGNETYVCQNNAPTASNGNGLSFQSQTNTGNIIHINDKIFSDDTALNSNSVYASDTYAQNKVIAASGTKLTDNFQDLLAMTLGGTGYDASNTHYVNGDQLGVTTDVQPSQASLTHVTLGTNVKPEYDDTFEVVDWGAFGNSNITGLSIKLGESKVYTLKDPVPDVSTDFVFENTENAGDLDTITISHDAFSLLTDFAQFTEGNGVSDIFKNLFTYALGGTGSETLNENLGDITYQTGGLPSDTSNYEMTDNSLDSNTYRLQNDGTSKIKFSKISGNGMDMDDQSFTLTGSLNENNTPIAHDSRVMIEKTGEGDSTQYTFNLKLPGILIKGIEATMNDDGMIVMKDDQVDSTLTKQHSSFEIDAQFDADVTYTTHTTLPSLGLEQLGLVNLKYDTPDDKMATAEKIAAARDILAQSIASTSQNYDAVEATSTRLSNESALLKEAEQALGAISPQDVTTDLAETTNRVNNANSNLDMAVTQQIKTQKVMENLQQKIISS